MKIIKVYANNIEQYFISKRTAKKYIKRVLKLATDIVDMDDYIMYELNGIPYEIHIEYITVRME
jgi:hypothetical protein